METTDQLTALLHLLIHGDKPVLVDTGDGIFIVADVTESQYDPSCTVFTTDPKGT